MVGAGTFACRPAEIFDEIAVAQLLFPEPLRLVFGVYLRLVVSVLFLLTNRLGEFQLFGVVLLLDGVFRLLVDIQAEELPARLLPGFETDDCGVEIEVEGFAPSRNLLLQKFNFDSHMRI